MPNIAQLEDHLSSLPAKDFLELLVQRSRARVTFSSSFCFEDQGNSNHILDKNSPVSIFRFDSGRLFLILIPDPDIMVDQRFATADKHDVHEGGNFSTAEKK